MLWAIRGLGKPFGTSNLLRRVTKINADTPMAVFSPDGRTIGLIGAGGIYLMNADGGNLRKIDALGDNGGLDWAR